MKKLDLDKRGSSSRSGTDSAKSTLTFGESTFNSLALDVTYAGLPSNSSLSPRQSSSPSSDLTRIEKRVEESKTDEELWEVVGVVECLEKGLGTPDDNTEEERVEALRELLQDSNIHEGDGDVSDFLFHVARTKHGKVYIRVIRTLLLNRGKSINHRKWLYNFFRLNMVLYEELRVKRRYIDIEFINFPI